MSTWLVKSEADVYSIDDLKRDGKTCWDCIRNYQARNFMRDMKKGERVFYYHSSSEPTGIVGIAKVVKEAYPDPTQFDRKSDYFDEKATPEAPRWLSPDIGFVKKLKAPLTLDLLRQAKGLETLEALRRGSRLSVTLITPHEEKLLMALAEG